jgi:hypothetical protein
LEIFEERYRRKSTLITAQIPVAAWHEMIGEATLADAILDRIVHNAHRITLEGDSMRKRKISAPLTGGEITEINHSWQKQGNRNSVASVVRDFLKPLSQLSEIRSHR